MQWALVVPVKQLRSAKSRLDGRTPADRARLALAFATDTVRTGRDTEGVDQVVVVTTDAEVRRALQDLAVVVEEPAAGGVNQAAEAGVAWLRAERPDLAVAVLVADLPALRPADLAAALRAAARHHRAFVADAVGSGTTLLTATPGHEPSAAFGPQSAAAHRRSAASELGGDFESLRRDVDVEEDLTAVLQLGVGPATRAALAART